MTEMISTLSCVAQRSRLCVRPRQLSHCCNEAVQPIYQQDCLPIKHITYYYNNKSYIDYFLVDRKLLDEAKALDEQNIAQGRSAVYSSFAFSRELPHGEKVLNVQYIFRSKTYQRIRWD